MAVRVEWGGGRQDRGGGDPDAEGGAVIGPTGEVRGLVATKPVNFRKGMDGVAVLVKEAAEQ